MFYKKSILSLDPMVIRDGMSSMHQLSTNIPETIEFFGSFDSCKININYKYITKEPMYYIKIYDSLVLIGTNSFRIFEIQGDYNNIIKSIQSMVRDNMYPMGVRMSYYQIYNEIMLTIMQFICSQ